MDRCTPCEIDAARRVAAALGFVRHVELDVDLAAFGGSSLVGDGAIPKDGVERAEFLRPTCRPATRSCSRSPSGGQKSLGAERIVIGINALDYSGYPDCRPEYLAAFEYLATLATRSGVEGQRDPGLGATPVADQGGHHPRGSGAWRRLRPDAQLLRPRTGRAALWRLRQLPPPGERVRRGRRLRSAVVTMSGLRGQ